MDALTEQIYSALSAVCESKRNSSTPFLPYLYVTKLNTSLNPPCRKIGCSGKDSTEGSERVGAKLSRYSTAIPDNWELYALVALDLDLDEPVAEYEGELFELLKKYRIKNGKELFCNCSNKIIDHAICSFIDSSDCVIQVHKDGTSYSPEEFTSKFGQQRKGSAVKESCDAQIYFWAHMLDSAYVK